VRAPCSRLMSVVFMKEAGRSYLANAFSALQPAKPAALSDRRVVSYAIVRTDTRGHPLATTRVENSKKRN